MLPLDHGGPRKPLSFFSRQLHPPEYKYSAFDHEPLILYLAVRQFRFFLEARSFMAYTSLKPLTLEFAKVSHPWFPRQQRHLSYISEVTTDVRRIAGIDNNVADALSRMFLYTVALQMGVDYTAMAIAQQIDEEMTAYRTAVNGLILEDIKFGLTNTTLLRDVSSGQPRPIVPSSWRRKVFEAVHKSLTSFYSSDAHSDY